MACREDYGSRSQLANAEFHLTAGQVEALIASGATPRDRVLLRLLAETGVRRAEAAALQWRDVDTTKRLVVIRRGKGGKLRVVPVTRELATELNALRDTAHDGPVFASRQAQSLSVRQVNRIVVAAGKRAGVKHPNPRCQQVTCHLLRHTFARLWKAEGGSIESLSKVLGHTSPETTWLVYGTESLADVQANYDAMMERIRRKRRR